MRSYLAILLLGAAVGCGDNIKFTGDGGTGDDGNGGDDSGGGGDDTPLACQPNSFTCDGDDLVHCGPAGTEDGRETCEAGCAGDVTPDPRCKHVVPTNVDPNMDLCTMTAAAGDFTPAANMTTMVNVSDAMCDVLIDQAAPNPKICVKIFNNINIPAGARVTFTGQNAVALVATGDITVAGEIDASANGITSGPGGGGMIMGAGTKPPTSSSAGGGGAGYLTNGGAGAVSSQLSGAVAGMPGMMNGTAEIAPARGGSIGGQGGPQQIANDTAKPGGGGGYLQLVACSELTIATGAILDAGGGGGGGGHGSAQATDPGGGGGGGGAGGSILLEAVKVTIQGGVFANGGGGGSGGAHGLNGVFGSNGNAGGDGTRNTSPAMGGNGIAGTGIVTGAGGTGGSLNTPPTAGGQPVAALVESSGGGGGSAGRIRINTRNADPTLNGQTISPVHTVGAVNTF